MSDYDIVTVDAGNVDEYGFFCVKNKKHPGYRAKRAWLERRFEEGLRILLIVTPGGRPAGFLEYAPAAASWRVVEAPGYLVIHCLWVASGKHPFPGMVASLLGRCLEQARAQRRAGVAVVTSDGPWMAGRRVFLKHGFEEVDRTEPRFQLLARRIGRGAAPAFPRDWQARLRPYRGLHLLYADQCPYIGKAVAELPPVAERYGVELELVRIESPAEARAWMPSPYGTVCLVYRGRLLEDHPISATRFKNILERDLGLKPRG